MMKAFFRDPCAYLACLTGRRQVAGQHLPAKALKTFTIDNIINVRCIVERADAPMKAARPYIAVGAHIKHAPGADAVAS
jgi:hypothetical protein